MRQNHFLSQATLLLLLISVACPQDPGLTTNGPLELQLKIETQARDLCLKEIKREIRFQEVKDKFGSCDAKSHIGTPISLHANVCDKDEYYVKKYLRLIKENRIKVDGELLAECQQQDKLFETTTWINVEALLESLGKAEKRCLSIIDGTIQPNQVCSVDEECIGDNVCRVDQKDKTRLVCQPPDRESCTPAAGSNSDCGKGEVCGLKNCVDFAARLSEKIVRTGGVNDGDSCKMSDECKISCSVCRKVGGQKICTTRATKGDECWYNDDCAKGLTCAGVKYDKKKDVLTKAGSCQPHVALGGKCFGQGRNHDDYNEHRCAEGLYCHRSGTIDGECRKIVGLGEECEEWSDCDHGLACDDKGVCVSSVILGSYCNEHWECDPLLGSIREKLFGQPSYYCDDDHHCKLSQPAGSSCMGDVACEQGTLCKKTSSEQMGQCKPSVGGAPCDTKWNCDSLHCLDGVKVCGANNPVAR